MKEFISKNKHALVLLYGIVYLIWFGLLEKYITADSDYYSVHIGLDDIIPFNEYFVIPYMLWFAYVAVVIIYLFFSSREEFLRCTCFLFVGMTICLIIYTIFPNGQDLRPTEFARDNIFVDIVKWLYSTDTSTNVCPSIHVYNSIGVHIAVLYNEKLRKNKWITSISWILVITISLATVFLKQHSALDGICAIILAIPMFYLSYKCSFKKVMAFIEREN